MKMASKPNGITEGFEALIEEALAPISKKIDEIHAGIDRNFDQFRMEMSLELRSILEKVDGKLKQVEQKIDTIDHRLNVIEHHIRLND